MEFVIYGSNLDGTEERQYGENNFNQKEIKEMTSDEGTFVYKKNKMFWAEEA